MPTRADLLDRMEYGPAPEGSADVRDWIAAEGPVLRHFIDGAFSADDGASLQVSEPARGAPLVRAPIAGAGTVDAAIAAARAAQPGWAALPGHERARHLYALARHLQKRSRFLAVLESIDNGKTIRESRLIDLPLAIRHFYHHAGWAELMADEFPGKVPVGVCAQVIPWNFPLLMLAWKIAPALATGNTVVLKPAEQTPLTAQAFARICDEIGLPRGVVNIVHGDGSTGACLSGHAGVDKVAFTGSTAVGREIARQLAGRGTRLSLELGGKSPFIVCDDADLDAAVEGVVDAVWLNQGEVCCAGTRLIVQEGVMAAFTDRLIARMQTLRVGDPLDKGMDIGALVSPAQLARVEGLLKAAVDQGATLVRAPGPLPDDGAFCAPGILTGTAPADDINQVEIFGPIASLLPFRTLDEAAEIANNSRYGLAASIWSETLTRAVDLAARVKAGVVWINATNLFDAGAPFGGMRESGFGREGAREGLGEYLRAPDARDGAPRPAPALAISIAPGGESGSAAAPAGNAAGAIDITAKLYIGGRQVRPDGGHSYAVTGATGATIGHAALAGAKDVRNAVEAATKAPGWGAISGHNRAQVLYYLGENLSQRAGDFTAQLCTATGATPDAASAEVEAAIRRCFWYAAQADKVDGAVHSTAQGHLTLALKEPFGVMGIVAPDEAPLLSLLSLILPPLAMGNRVVAVAAQSHPLVAATLIQVLETSDIPPGVVNLLTGARDDLALALAGHDGIDALWYCGAPGTVGDLERAGAGNLKPVWSDPGRLCDWADKTRGQGRDFLDRACQIKTVWLPYGD